MTQIICVSTKFSQHFFNQSEKKAKPIVTRVCTFSRALCRLRVITLSFGWFTGFSPSILIVRSNYLVLRHSLKLVLFSISIPKMTYVAQEHVSRSLPLPYKPYESTFALIFLYLEPILQRETHILIYINSHNLRTLFLLFLPWLDNDFILIGHFKQCVQCRTTRGVLKIERYGQRLTQGYSAYGGSYSWAPV